MEVFITEDKNLAFLTVSEREVDNLSHKIIIDFLVSNGVVAGLIPDNIDRIIKDRYFGKRVLVAHGRKQVSGRFVSVKIIAFEGEEACNTKPICLGHPGVNVFKGQVVALKIGSGQSGFKVDGEIIKMRIDRDVPLPSGPGLSILEDRYLIADYDGSLVYEDGMLRVDSYLSIQGDVDSGIGDIYFVGNTFIKGNVHPNISIYSKGNLSIEGDLDGTNVESCSSIGISGNTTNSRIFSHEGISLKSVLNSNLISTKDITLSSSTSSFIYCGERLEADSLMNTQVSARNGVKVNEIKGGTSITIGVDPFIQNTRDDARQRLNHLIKDREQLSQIINTTREKLSIKQVDEEDFLTSAINLIDNPPIDRSKGQELILLMFKAFILNEEIAELSGVIKKEENLHIGAELNVRGKIIPPLEVILGTRRVIVNEETTGLNLKLE